jgi:hypothetical protein
MEELGVRISSFCKNLYPKFIPKFESLCGKELKPVKTPMSEGYHPGTDDLLLFTDDFAKYRSKIGCCVWITLLGRFDITYATYALSRFHMSPG